MTEQEKFEQWISKYHIEKTPSNKTLLVLAEEAYLAAKQDSAAEFAKLKEVIEKNKSTYFAIEEQIETLREIKIEQECRIKEIRLDNLKLREALLQASRQLDLYEPSSTVCKIVSEALATPAQSLQEHDNELIERCAKVCDEYYAAGVGVTIRELKGK